MDKDFKTKEELHKATGAAGSAIGLYLKKGLIPPPKVVSNYKGKKGRVGLYDPICIEKIKKIKGLTDENYTLDEIKRKLDEEDRKSNSSLQEEAAKLLADILKTVGKHEYSKEERDMMKYCLDTATGATANSAVNMAENINQLKKINEEKEGA